MVVSVNAEIAVFITFCLIIWVKTRKMNRQKSEVIFPFVMAQHHIKMSWLWNVMRGLLKVL